MEAIDTMAEGFAIYDGDDRLVLWNSRYRFFPDRYFPAIFCGARFQDIVRCAVDYGFYPAAEGRRQAFIAERVAYHRNPCGAFQAQLADGRWLQIVERRMPSGGTVALNTDVTALKRQEEALRQSQKLEALGQLIGGIAHDFNNLLLALRCNLDLLERGVRGDVRLEGYCGAIRASADLAGGMTQRLLAFARRQPLQARATDLNGVVSHMVEFLRRILPDAIEIATDLQPRLWRVLVDPTQLETTLLNLALNARDAMPGGGRLTITTAKRRLGREWVARHPDMLAGAYVDLAFADTGCGMTKEVARRAFDPFFTTKESGRGTGLGLSMVYGFVKQSGGTLELDSEEGMGTCVRLLFPRVDTAPG